MTVNQYQVHGLTCEGCAATVKNALNKVDGVQKADVSLSEGVVTLETAKTIPLMTLQGALAGYAYQLTEPGQGIKTTGFWSDQKKWIRASGNTLNCLVGCSLGDFGMVLYLQAYHPSVSMSMQMILATVAGLVTSVLLETVLLHQKEKFEWSFALRTALSMSFLSMVAMELVMNATDFMITGGKAAFDNPLYWTALLVAMVAGFLAPLPYNYFRLKKYDKACH